MPSTDIITWYHQKPRNMHAQWHCDFMASKSAPIFIIPMTMVYIGNLWFGVVQSFNSHVIAPTAATTAVYIASYEVCVFDSMFHLNLTRAVEFVGHRTHITRPHKKRKLLCFLRDAVYMVFRLRSHALDLDSSSSISHIHAYTRPHRKFLFSCFSGRDRI